MLDDVEQQRGCDVDEDAVRPKGNTVRPRRCVVGAQYVIHDRSQVNFTSHQPIVPIREIARAVPGTVVFADATVVFPLGLPEGFRDFSFVTWFISRRGGEAVRAQTSRG